MCCAQRQRLAKTHCAKLACDSRGSQVDICANTYLSVEVVASELNGRVRYNADAIGTITSHEASPAFLSPHLGQRLVDGHLVVGAVHILDLEQDLEALEGGDDSSRYGSGDTSGAKGGHDGLGYPGSGLAKLAVVGLVGRDRDFLESAVSVAWSDLTAGGRYEVRRKGHVLTSVTAILECSAWGVWWRVLGIKKKRGEATKSFKK